MIAMGAVSAAASPPTGPAARSPSVAQNGNQGNLKVPTDYRSVYLSVLEEWLDGETAGLIGGGAIEPLVRGDGHAGGRRLFK